MSIARHHAEWLSLIDISGPFLSMPVLLSAFPQGLDQRNSDQAAELRSAHEEWADNQQGLRPDRALHTAWIRYVLTSLLDLEEERVLQRGQAIPQGLKAALPERHEVIRPDWVIVDPSSGTPVLLVGQYPANQDLEQRLEGDTTTLSPATRMMTLLHATGVALGLVTNGEQWMLVHARPGETTGFASWYASLWHEEPLTLRAFQTLLRASRFFGVPEEETLASLLLKSASDQHEVTDQLGKQVRAAVEILVQEVAKADAARGGQLLASVSEQQLYEAALTVMMRLVFLLSAEERELLLLGDPTYDANYAVSTLRGQLRELADRLGEDTIEKRYDAWSRLLATFRAVHGGISHEDLRLPAYGGSLFDPDRFPFLEGRASASSWQTSPADPLPISNLTVLRLLEALQQLRVPVPGAGTITRLLSFRALDIEQIGHVYEGLLDHKAVRTEEAVVGLEGTKDKEPEVSLATLETELTKGETSFIKWLNKETKRSESALRKSLHADLDRVRAQRLRTACENDQALYERVRPFAGLIRDDVYDYPMVIPAGSVYVTTGTDRRESGAHYTPRSLTEPIVQHTLEPLVYHGPAEGEPREQWRLRPAEVLLSLKICDMAMGSGAFLVQACRYLAERVVEAIEAEGKMARGKKTAESDGLAALREAENAAERETLARRLVADRCLYGVDKLPLAVEIAKLSLWLTTMSRGKPFTFLDHALRVGDSLVGIDSTEQLVAWDLQPAGEHALQIHTVQSALEEVIRLRKEIEATPVRDSRDQDHKQALLRRAEARTHDLRAGADLLVGSYFNELSKSDQQGLRRSLLYAFRDGKDVRPEHAAQAKLGDVRPFHWPLEFPEVFLDEGRDGFDAFVGNPPFVGGKRIRRTLGNKYRNILPQIFLGSSGNADLSAFFFLRAFENLQANGALGLIATNTISQGDTLETGLAKIVKRGGTIFRATNNQQWPGVAAVVVDVVHLARGEMQPPFMLDGREVKYISGRLDRFRAIGNPYQLKENEDRSFVGSFVNGIGFILEPEEAQALIEQNPKNADVVHPYLNGSDLNSYPDQSPSRWAINFFDWPLRRGASGSWVLADRKQRREWRQSGIVPNDYSEPVAADYPDCLQIVRERVKPQRDEVRRKAHRKYWWHYGDKRPALYNAISPLERVLVIAQTSQTAAPVFVSNGTVYSHKVIVFATASSNAFTILQSAFHEQWARKYCSTLKQDLSYTPTTAFQTLPFPRPTPQQRKTLECIGEDYHEHRRQLMLAREEGLTATYNRFHDPEEVAKDIVELRRLHVEMDHAVAAAYGWDDLALDHGFHETQQGLRYTISEAARREVLGRLLELNHERYEEEQRQGLHGKGKATGQGKRGKKPGKVKEEPGQGRLL